MTEFTDADFAKARAVNRAQQELLALVESLHAENKRLQTMVRAQRDEIERLEKELDECRSPTRLTKSPSS